MLTNEEINYYLLVTEKMNKWGLISAAVIALLGNPLTAGVYMTKPLKGQSFSIYYPVILISDTFTLLIGSLVYWQSYLYSKNDIYCRIVTYLANVLPVFSSWILTILSVDRALSIFFPHRFKFLHRPKFQLAIMLVAFILPSVLVLHLVIQAIDTDYKLTEWNCAYRPPAGYNIKIYFFVFSSCFALIPFVVMITSSVLMIYRLKALKRNVSCNNLKKMQKFSRITIGTNLYFLIALLPYIIINSVLLIMEASEKKISFEQYLYINFANSFSNLCLWVYYSTSILIHLLCNKVFRAILVSWVKRPFKFNFY